MRLLFFILLLICEVPLAAGPITDASFCISVRESTSECKKGRYTLKQSATNSAPLPGFGSMFFLQMEDLLECSEI